MIHNEHIPAGPVAPVAPEVPFRPLAPAGPGNPVGPDVSPVLPLRQGVPFAPGDPFAPYAPGDPDDPAEQTSPVAPVRPPAPGCHVSKCLKYHINIKIEFETPKKFTKSKNVAPPIGALLKKILPPFTPLIVAHPPSRRCSKIFTP